MPLNPCARPVAGVTALGLIPPGGPHLTSSATAIERSTLGLHSLETYAPLIGKAEVERISAAAERVRTLKVAHVSSTFYGGGVTEILTPLTLLMNATGIETDWHLVQGTPGFLAQPRSCTMHFRVKISR